MVKNLAEVKEAVVVEYVVKMAVDVLEEVVVAHQFAMEILCHFWLVSHYINHYWTSNNCAIHGHNFAVQHCCKDSQVTITFLCYSVLILIPGSWKCHGDGFYVLLETMDPLGGTILS